MHVWACSDSSRLKEELRERERAREIEAPSAAVPTKGGSVTAAAQSTKKAFNYDVSASAGTSRRKRLVAVPQDQTWQICPEPGIGSQSWFSRLCVVYIGVPCSCTIHAHITPGTLVHCHALFHCQWPPCTAPHGSPFQHAVSNPKQMISGKNRATWRGEGGRREETNKGKKIESIITLAKHQELKKRERERKKRRSMGKFIFSPATINLWPKEIHNN